jgi:hypothetical protein
MSLYIFFLLKIDWQYLFYPWLSKYQGWIQGGGEPPGGPPKIGKNMIFWRKIVIFHTKYPKHFRASLHSAQFFLTAPP